LDVDLDPEKEINGREALTQLQSQHGQLPATWTQQTPRGGYHLIFRYPNNLNPEEKVKTSAGELGPGLDVRGDGGYIIVAPSARADGRSYQSINGPDQLAEAPAWLLDMVLKSSPQKKEVPQSVTDGEPQRSMPNVREQQYANKVFKEELEKVRSAPEGERNDTLNRSGFILYRLVAGGYLDDETVYEELVKAGVEREDLLPDDKAEMMRTIASAREAGLANPRKISSIPSGFELREDGIYCRSTKDGKGVWRWIGGPIEVLGYIRDEASESWGLQVRWKDPDGAVHTASLQRSALVSDDKSWLGRLASGGWACATASGDKMKLAEFFARLTPERFLRSVDRTGWQGEAFVLPNLILTGRNPAAEEAPDICLASALAIPPIYHRQGSLEGWQRSIGKWSAGNSRLMLGISAALAAPLLEVVGLESGGFNFVGSSSIGKTTALLAAASVWGKGSVDSGSGYIRTWRATSNGLEGVAALHNDALLCLDELGQAPGKAAGEAAYMLANGMGKSRANRAGDARPAKVWRTLILSTGELGLAEKIRAEGGKSQAGQEVRLIDLPADADCGYGLFEALHDFATPREFSEALKQSAATNYGHLAPAFINRFIDLFKRNQAGNKARLPEWLEGARQTILEGQGEVDGQVQRVAGRFALCLVAGRLAISFKLVPWEITQLKEAIQKCFQAWLGLRGTAGALEQLKIVEQIGLFIEKNGGSRFQSIGKDVGHYGPPCPNRAGYRLNQDSAVEYYFLPRVFKEEVCEGFHFKTACKVLYDAGLLIKKETGKYISKVPTKVDGGYPYCYLITIAVPQTA
jgi:putative DNA primase/helicase